MTISVLETEIKKERYGVLAEAIRLAFSKICPEKQVTVSAHSEFRNGKMIVDFDINYKE